MIPTASQTTGPFFPPGFVGPESNDLTVGRLGERIAGDVIVLDGLLLDGAGAPVDNGIVELVQANAAGRFASMDDAFKGSGRTWTDGAGRFRFRTIKPGAVGDRAPHLTLMLLGSGLMRPLVTEVFFPDEPLNDTDRQLMAIADPVARRRLILAPGASAGHFHLEIRLRGGAETPFLAGSP